MHHRIHIDLELNFSSLWHAGSGEGSLETDRLIRRNSANRPFIPASSLKGIIRQSCEKLSRTCGFDEPSDPHQSDLMEQQSFVPFSQMASPVDRLFGTKYEPGGLFFRDAHLKNDQDDMPEKIVRNRTALYRVLKTARDKQLFSTEYAPPDIFYTEIDGWHNDLASLDDDYPPYAYCLLIAGILMVERIGGDKSTGAGWLNNGIGVRNAVYNKKPIKLDDDFFDLLNPDFYKESRGES